MLSPGMQKMVRELLRSSRTDLPPQRTLILARSTPEMVAIAKYADNLHRAQDFSRTAYEGDDRFLFVLSYVVQDGEEPADLWVANMHEAVPDTFSYFADGGDATDYVAWPDEEGLYIVVPYSVWKETWHPGRSDGFDHDRPYPDPFFRPADVLYALRFDVGKPEGWAPPGRKVSVWEHIRRNVRASMPERKEVKEMVAKKKAVKAKTKAKVKSPKTANKKSAAKKPAKV